MRALAAVFAATLVGALASGAEGAFPGRNGLIAFVSERGGPEAAPTAASSC